MKRNAKEEVIEREWVWNEDYRCVKVWSGRSGHVKVEDQGGL